MNKKLGLSLTAILLTATHALPVQSSTSGTTNARMDDSSQDSLQRSLFSSNQNSNQTSWLEAFNPIKHPNPPTDQPLDSSGIISYFYDHELDGQPVATIYVEEIPVFTFLNQNAIENATQLSDRLNQLHRNHVDPETITAHWNEEKKSYTINVGDEILITMNKDVILADSTDNPAEDTRQAANRLRRLLSGNTVDSLSTVEGQPTHPQVSTARVIQESRGIASWYGPGFNGRRSANGEIFNQNALTAAHRTLPFGTMVRVTNLNNGRSVVVRINDRGPFTGNRILDLSAGAARQINMISSGVAPIRLEVLR